MAPRFRTILGTGARYVGPHVPAPESPSSFVTQLLTPTQTLAWVPPQIPPRARPSTQSRAQTQTYQPQERSTFSNSRSATDRTARALPMFQLLQS